MFEIYFKNFTLSWITATFGFKKEMKSTFMLKFCNVFDNVVLSAQFNGKKFNYIPRYLNCTSWNEDFDDFEKFLSDFKPNNFCIVGDLNSYSKLNKLLIRTKLLIYRILRKIATLWIRKLTQKAKSFSN